MFNISIEIKESNVQAGPVEFNLNAWLEVLVNNEFFKSQPALLEMLVSEEFQYEQQYAIQGYFLKLLGGSTTRNFEKKFESKLNDATRELLTALYDELDVLRELAHSRYVPTRDFRSF